MESPPATMTSTAGATRLHRGLPEELVVWEILLRLPPKPLLRCRAVCRAWRRATSTHAFLQAQHAQQRSLPVVSWSRYDGHRYEEFLAFDHKAAAVGTRLQPLVRVEDSFYPEASCEGILIYSSDDVCLSVCNPTTRQHAPLPQLSGFDVLGMYAHRPTGEYRVLLRRIYHTDCYVFALGSDHPPRHVGVMEGVGALAYLDKPTLLRHSLHWYIVHYPHLYQVGHKDVIVFDTMSESFRRMRAPVVPENSYIFEMDGTLGIYSYNDTTQIVDIWVLRDYESEVWGHKYRVELPAEEIKRFVWGSCNWHVTVLSVDGDVLLLVTHGGWMFHVGIDGKLVDSFHRDGQHASTCKLSLKQTLVPHAFFAALEGYVVNTSPFL
ncbi:hypothetical protein QYE76_025792 [Lolium multiflorum]|uniref:F-box domain-containing protein n=1 Tax=Lolium multiflorum TaxID=4521 RepID=A0AAD8RG97_LOLMU|nr:hypothetical protein QYE76_025792 [Lolium multiflorum]